MGTVSYMSPEQARGDELDARSDLFSLGCVLYEMAAGQRAFPGKTSAVIFHAILERSPAPLHDVNPNVPAKLEEIIAKTLEKDREMRYQSAGELRADLKRLRRDIDSGRASTSSGPAISTSAANLPPISEGGTSGTRPASGAVPTLLPPQIDMERKVGEILGRRRSSKGRTGLVLRMVAAAFAVFLAWRLFGPKHESAPGSDKGSNPTASLTSQPASVFPSLTLTRLTTGGNVFGAAISRDGKYVALITVNGFFKEGIVMRQISTGSTVELVPPQNEDLTSLAFSPDGSFLYYLQSSSGGKTHNYYQIPSLGGVPRLVASGILSGAALSPDGTKIAYVGIAPGSTKPQLLTSSVGATSAPPLVLPADAEHDRLDDFAWSPNGKTLAMIHLRTDAAGLQADVQTMDAEDGDRPEPLGKTRWRDAVGGLVWSQDGQGLLLNARDQTGKPSQVWFVSWPQGVARQVSNGLTNLGRSISITGDGKSFVTVQSDGVMNLWIAPKGEDKSARQITTGRSDGYNGMAWTQDGRIAYSSNSSGSWQIWLTDAEGGAPRQLTSDSRYHASPTVCRGTGRVYFSYDAPGGFQLWSVGLDDGQLRQEWNGEAVGNEQFFGLDCSPDGTWFAGLAGPKGAPVEFHSAGRPVRVDRATGKMTTLFDGEASYPKISPDGKHVAFLYHPSATGGTGAAASRICVVGAAGGVEKTFDFATATFPIPDIRWTPNGRELAYLELRGGASNVWLQPLDGGKPKQLTHFADGLIFTFGWSWDGKLLGLSRGTYQSDAVMFSEN
jgi:eukaryotic-like serine/threonine-protein kinase